MKGDKRMKYIIKTFNDLTNEELYKILKARVDVFVVEQTCPYPEIDNYDQEAIHYFLNDGEEIMGYVRILPSGSRYSAASIGRVIVTTASRANGYARNIITKAIQYRYDAWKETKIKLQAQVYLETFYASLGFERISAEYLEDNIPHVDMIRRGEVT